MHIAERGGRRGRGGERRVEKNGGREREGEGTQGREKKNGERWGGVGRQKRCLETEWREIEKERERDRELSDGEGAERETDGERVVVGETEERGGGKET